MKRTTLFALATLGVAVGCSSDFGVIRPTKRIDLAITAGDRGSPDRRLPLSVTASSVFTVSAKALNADGTVDTSFNGFVRVSVKPGTVKSVTGAGTDGRNVQLKNGVADNVNVEIIAAYGDARIWLEDIGYVPADPVGPKPPQCADGIDNNGNGLIDFPADPGCAYPNDDSEDGGSYSAGASDILYYVSPRIADVRGISAGGNGTVFPHEQVEIDTGWRGAANYAFNTVVTRVASDGFYVTDLQDDATDPTKRPGFGSVYAFTYSTPPNMRVCDRVKVFSGTASDFYGFTEIGYPTWVIEEWDPSLRPCLVPPPHVISASEYGNAQALFKWESALVRVQAQGTVTLHVSGKLGPANVPLVNGNYVPSADATNCDFNKDGKIAFDGGPENLCSTACTSDPECSEYSAFGSQSELMLIAVDSANPMAPPTKYQVSGAQAPGFDPIAQRGKNITAFTGTVRYFSGGNQFTIEARCDDDIIYDPNGRPFCSDADYDAQDPSCPTSDGKPAVAHPIPPAQRLLACVHARTILDNNEGL